jgi:hypothetical protein
LATVYIDPDAAGGGSGTEASPLNTWPTTFTAGNEYLQKRGTTATSVDIDAEQDNVTVGAYGTGAPPILQEDTAGANVIDAGTGTTPDGLIVENVTVDGTSSSAGANQGIAFRAANNIARDVTVTRTQTQGVRGHTGASFVLKNFSIEDIGDDGVYCDGNVSVQIHGGVIRDVQQDTVEAVGDCIQVLNGCTTHRTAFVRGFHEGADKAAFTARGVFTNELTVEDCHFTVTTNNGVSLLDGNSSVKRCIVDGGGARAYLLDDREVAATTVTMEGCVANASNINIEAKDAGAVYVVQHSTLYGATEHSWDCATVSTVNITHRNCIHVMGAQGGTDYVIDLGSGTKNYTASNNCYDNISDGWRWSDNTVDTTIANWESASGETNSLDTDPLLINPSAGDFRLQGNSPCIGAGTKYWPTPGTQPLGQDGLRFPLRGGSPDIGAYPVRPDEDAATRQAAALPASYMDAGCDIGKARKAA